MATVPCVVIRTRRRDFAHSLKLLQLEQHIVVGPIKAPPPAESARKSTPAKLSEYHTSPQTPEGAGVLGPRSSMAVLAVLVYFLRQAKA